MSVLRYEIRFAIIPIVRRQPPHFPGSDTFVRLFPSFTNFAAHVRTALTAYFLPNCCQYDHQRANGTLSVYWGFPFSRRFIINARVTFIIKILSRRSSFYLRFSPVTFPKFCKQNFHFDYTNFVETFLVELHVIG